MSTLSVLYTPTNIPLRSARSSSESSNLRPTSIDDGGLSPNGAQLTSPSDMVGPSPVTSNGTETTEIEDEIAEDIQEATPTPPKVPGSADSTATVCATFYIKLILLTSYIAEETQHERCRSVSNHRRR